MSVLAPFTVHVRVVVPRPGKRMEYQRQLQRAANHAYTGLSALAGINVATPGGGQASSQTGFTNITNGCAVVPQMANQPAQVRIPGFYEVNRDPVQAWAVDQTFSGGEAKEGHQAHPQDANQSSTIQAEVRTLKALIESGLTAQMPDDVSWNVFRIDYAGTVYGDRGVTFPV